MKKQVTLLLALIILSTAVRSQTNQGWERIFSSSPHQIIDFQKNFDYILNENLIFIQLKNQNSYSYIGDDYYRLNKSTKTFFKPYNNFIGLHCAMIPGPYGGINCLPVTFFKISPRDTNFIMTYRGSPGAECPDAQTFRSTNAGLDFNMLPYFGCGGFVFNPYGLSFDPNNDHIIYYGYINHNNFSLNNIFKSTDRGINWSVTQSLENLREVTHSYYQSPGGFIEVVPFKTDHIFAAGEFNLYLSTQAGYNFNMLNVPTPDKIYFKNNDSTIYGTLGNKLYRSVDDGLSWSYNEFPFQFTSLEFHPENVNVIYAGSISGLYRSIDNGNTFLIYNNSFSPSKHVIGLAKDPNTIDTIYVCTPDGFYKVFKDFLVDVNNLTTNLPQEFSLHQNYPNPFNPTTNIKFSLPTTQYTILKVFDIAGREVATLVNEVLKPEEYNYEFRITDYKISSGVYFYQLKTDEFVQTRKMVLTK